VRGQRVPIGDKKQARIFVLETNPILEYAMIVTKVQRAGWAHAGEDSFRVHDDF
jgi:hypothetical protein